uniref:DNA-directed RNA polymerase subunit n=1 Tax=Araucaria cunninghamii TaxID=56994 RepID=A0A0D6R9A9_ARACU
MEFCPTCGNMLQIERPYGVIKALRFFCPTCPYVFPIKGKITKKIPLAKKEVDDVFGGEEAWKNVDRTEATCPKCNHGQAYFMQIQIRSADEPMSTFYKCCNFQCQFRWRQD